MSTSSDPSHITHLSHRSEIFQNYIFYEFVYDLARPGLDLWKDWRRGIVIRIHVL